MLTNTLLRSLLNRNLRFLSMQQSADEDRFTILQEDMSLAKDLLSEELTLCILCSLNEKRTERPTVGRLRKMLISY